MLPFLLKPIADILTSRLFSDAKVQPEVELV